MLAGNELVGVTPGDMAGALGVSPSVVTRDLANLRESGPAKRSKRLLLALAPKLVQIATFT